MSCDFFTRSKWSFDAKDEFATLMVVVVGSETAAAPEYNVCGTEYEVDMVDI
jgi:hypothetical protein